MFVLYHRGIAEGIFPDSTTAFRYVARSMGRGMSMVAVKDAMEAGWRMHPCR